MDASRVAVEVIKRLWIATLAGAAIMAMSVTDGRAQEEGIDKAKADSFDARMFAGPLGKNAYACFVRRYDADHLAQHPKQKVRVMQLLVTAEIRPEEETTPYSFRLGLKYRHRSGDFDSSGYCNHGVAEHGGKEIQFNCGVDCEGGGIQVALSNDDKSAIIRLESIRVWQRNKPDDDSDLTAGADDKIFRLDRVDTGECAALVTDRKELAAIRHK